MKKLLLLLLTLLPFNLYAQELPDDLLEKANSIKGIDMNEIKEREVDRKNVMNFDKIREADRLLLKNKISLLVQANMDLFHQLSIHRKEKRLQREAENRELMIADRWQSSKTGRIDGRSWFDLLEDEKRYYREKFFSYFAKK